MADETFLAKAIVGQSSELANGVETTQRTDEFSRSLVNVSGASLAAAALGGRIYSAANQAAVACSAALATGWTGLGVANPVGSRKNLIIHEFGYAATVVNPADSSIGIMTAAYDTGFTAAITIRQGLPSGPGSAALADDGATVETPVLERVYGTVYTGAVSVAPSVVPSQIDLKGAIIVEPGRCILTYSFIALSAALEFYFVWEEVDV